MSEETKSKTNRQLISELLVDVHPELDVGDDETLFGQIYNDYEKYAEMINHREQELTEAERRGELRGRNAQIEAMLDTGTDSDGVPDLGGANTVYSPQGASIFDIARGEFEV